MRALIDFTPIPGRLSRILPTLALGLALLASGCDQQPVGYIFEPGSRDKSTLALTTMDVINSLYDLSDEATAFLDRASLTQDFSSLFPPGWIEIPQIDSVTGDPYELYLKNYLDQEFSLLRFDPDPLAGAVRNPSSLMFRYAKVRSYQNPATSEFYGDLSEIQELQIEYSDERHDPTAIDGWFYFRKVVPVEQEIETAGAGTVTYTVNILVTWVLRIEDYSIDPKDHRSRISIAGIFPIVDDTNEYQQTQVTGEIEIDGNARGSGTLVLYGREALDIHFTGRSFGFKGYYTFPEDNHRKRYVFD